MTIKLIFLCGHLLRRWGQPLPVGVVPIGKSSTFQVHLFNYTQDDMLLKSVDLDFEVYAVDPASGGMGTLVYSRSLPTLAELVPSHFGYEATFTWDQKGRMDKLCRPANI
jgi:hypothetical protein